MRARYPSLGPKNIPVRPAIIVIEDRGDGTHWQLIHDAVAIRIGITDAALSAFQQADTRFYPAGEEPIIAANPAIRLIVRDGILGYSVENLGAGEQDRDNAPVLSRVLGATSALYYEINAGDATRHWQSPGDRLGFREFEI